MYVGLGLENGGFPINVSDGGMAFQGIRPLEKDQLIQIKFQLPGLNDSVESTAQIAWLNELGKGGGLRFIDLPEDMRYRISEWLSLQTSSSDLVEDAHILRVPLEAHDFQSSPIIDLETNHSSAQADSSADETLPDPPLSPVAAALILTTGDATTIPFPSVPSEQGFGFRDPFLGIKTQDSWSKPFSLRLLASLAIAAIFGMIAVHFRGDSQVLNLSGNSTRPARMAESINESVNHTIRAPKKPVSQPTKRPAPPKI